MKSPEVFRSVPAQGENLKVAIVTPSQKANFRVKVDADLSVIKPICPFF
jgi:hypothetical protein